MKDSKSLYSFINTYRESTPGSHNRIHDKPDYQLVMDTDIAVKESIHGKDNTVVEEERNQEDYDYNQENDVMRREHVGDGDEDHFDVDEEEEEEEEEEDGEITKDQKKINQQSIVISDEEDDGNNEGEVLIQQGEQQSTTYVSKLIIEHCWFSWKLKERVQLALVSWSWFDIVSTLYSDNYHATASCYKSLLRYRNHLVSKYCIFKYLHSLSIDYTYGHIITCEQNPPRLTNSDRPLYFMNLFSHLSRLDIHLKRSPVTVFRGMQDLVKTMESSNTLSTLTHFTLISYEESNVVNEILYNIQPVTLNLQTLSLYSKNIDLDALSNFITERANTLTNLTLFLFQEDEVQVQFYKEIFSTMVTSDVLVKLCCSLIPEGFPWELLDSFNNLTTIEWKKPFQSTPSFHRFFKKNQTMINYGSFITLDKPLLETLPFKFNIDQISLIIDNNYIGNNLQQQQQQQQQQQFYIPPQSILVPISTTTPIVNEPNNDMDIWFEPFLPPQLKSLELLCMESNNENTVTECLLYNLQKHPSIINLTCRNLPIDISHIAYLISQSKLTYLNIGLRNNNNNIHLALFYRILESNKTLRNLIFTYPHNNSNLVLLEKTLVKNRSLFKVEVTLDKSNVKYRNLNTTHNDNININNNHNTHNNNNNNNNNNINTSFLSILTPLQMSIAPPPPPPPNHSEDLLNTMFKVKYKDNVLIYKRIKFGVVSR